MTRFLLNNLLLGLPTMVVCLLLQATLISPASRCYKRNEHQMNLTSRKPCCREGRP